MASRWIHELTWPEIPEHLERPDIALVLARFTHPRLDYKEVNILDLDHVELN